MFEFSNPSVFLMRVVSELLCIFLIKKISVNVMKGFLIQRPCQLKF